MVYRRAAQRLKRGITYLNQARIAPGEMTHRILQVHATASFESFAEPRDKSSTSPARVFTRFQLCGNVLLPSRLQEILTIHNCTTGPAHFSRD